MPLIRTFVIDSQRQTVIANSPEISDLTKKDIFQLNSYQNGEKNDKSVFLQISAVFGTS